MWPVPRSEVSRQHGFGVMFGSSGWNAARALRRSGESFTTTEAQRLNPDLA